MRQCCGQWPNGPGVACPFTGQAHQLGQGEHLRPNQFIALAVAGGRQQGSDQGLGHVLHPHRLERGLGTGQGHHRGQGLQLRKHIDEAVIGAKHHAGLQQGQLQAVARGHVLQQRIALGFAAQIHGRATHIHAQGAHVHQAAHTLIDAGLGQQAGQLHMHMVKALGGAVQDGHQVDDRIVAAHQGRQLGRVVHIGTHQGHPRQHLYAARWQAACGDGGVQTGALQGLAHMVTNEAAPTQDQYFLHGRTVTKLAPLGRPSRESTAAEKGIIAP